MQTKILLRPYTDIDLNLFQKVNKIFAGFFYHTFSAYGSKGFNKTNINDN
ncbi:MAG: hypothetical protein LAT68_10975 [Cyclobacteriaceae bacterium]|nr:hypothetical protein [Cyclobacteriaceae bacterium]MCH8516837.1 hypothetical protein [Cyclobacteriaceae bacterium]